MGTELIRFSQTLERAGGDSGEQSPAQGPGGCIPGLCSLKLNEHFLNTFDFLGAISHLDKAWATVAGRGTLRGAVGSPSLPHGA